MLKVSVGEDRRWAKDGEKWGMSGGVGKYLLLEFHGPTGPLF